VSERLTSALDTGSYEWLLVRVSDPVPVPAADNWARLVKSAKGRSFTGKPKAASDILSGWAPIQTGSSVASCRPR
jgi:hypothetical protein